MSAEPQREFVDANVLVYAFDQSAGQKQQDGQTLLERLWENNVGSVSIQVLEEFFVTVTRKVARPLPLDDAKARLREFSAWKVFLPRAMMSWPRSTCRSTPTSDSGMR
jgi:predicted nucleic acid-binding protein